MNVFNRVTLETLKKNRVRTLVTIIGIILSAAMFTAVTTSISSLKEYLANTAKASDGSWYGYIKNLTEDELNTVMNDSEINESLVLKNVGYAKIDSQNSGKPYIFIYAAADNQDELLPITLTEGRMPEKSGEIIISETIWTNGELKLNLGDELVLDVGYRECLGDKVYQSTAFQNENENIIVTESRTFTVVGFFSRLSTENYFAPGYTSFTYDDGIATDSCDLYFTLKKMSRTNAFLEKYPQVIDSDVLEMDINADYLRYSGMSMGGSYDSVVYGLAGVLILIIMFGSISLIYNAFSISVSERTKQFGLLKSIGATKRQMKKSVLFEAFILSVIGIPLGIIAGIAGIGVTLKLLSGKFEEILGTATGVELTLTINAAALIIAALTAMLTVLISAYIPAKRAVKLSPIDAIRQTGDIAVKAGSVRTSKLTYILFGFEGTLASKNYKRNKKKYRATVFSLFASIVLFISTSTFCSYLNSSTQSVIGETKYDICYSMSSADAEGHDVDKLMDELGGIDGVEDIARVYRTRAYAQADIENFDDTYINFIKAQQGEDNIEAFLDFDDNLDFNLYFVDDKSYAEYLDANGYDKSIYMNAESPVGIAYDYSQSYIYDLGKYFTYSILKDDSYSYNMTCISEVEAMSWDPETGEYDDEIMDETLNSIKPLTIGMTTDNIPFFKSTFNNHDVAVFYPLSAVDSVLPTGYDDRMTSVYIKAANHNEVFKEVVKTLDENNIANIYVSDYAAGVESDRALILIISVFTGGFIVLISLIAVANVFNTISTNINLRRREFAMLRSIGMTKRGMNKMMNFECILYGTRSLLFGIPVSFAVAYLIYLSINNGLEISFYVPWYSIVIAVGSVFAVVFTTMMYSMNKIKKDNPIDALRNENM